MLTNGTVTIYHFDEQNEEYAPISYGDANIFHRKRSADEKGGFTAASQCIIRIPTDKAIAIETGDYVYLGTTSAPLDRDSCLLVTGYSDNRRGTLKHWRIECGSA